VIELLPVEGLPEVRPGDVVADLIADRAELRDGDVVVVTQKVVSKAEGRLAPVSSEGERRRLVEQESVRVLRRRADLFISETAHGFVCANAGVDLSNVETGWAALLPIDPDLSARRIRDRLRARAGVEVGVVVSDTFGRPWRNGLVDVAIGCAGVAAVADLRGLPDAQGRPMEVTEIAVADQVASAAELAMGKASGIPAVVVRGLDPAWLRESSIRAEVVRPYDEDLFR